MGILYVQFSTILQQATTISSGQAAVANGATAIQFGFMQVVVSRVPSNTDNGTPGLTVSCQWAASSS